MKVDHEKALRAAQGFGTGYAVADDDTVRLVFEAYVQLRERHDHHMSVLRERMRRAAQVKGNHEQVERAIDEILADTLVETR